MNKAQWIARKNYLCGLIREVSGLHGGDDIEFLRSVCKETIELYPDDEINAVIFVYEDIKENLYKNKYFDKNAPKLKFERFRAINDLEYRRPFFS